MTEYTKTEELEELTEAAELSSLDEQSSIDSDEEEKASESEFEVIKQEVLFEVKDEKIEKDRVRNLGKLQVYRVDQNGCFISLNDRKMPEFTQTKEVERWLIDESGTELKEPLPDGNYIILRIVKGIKISSIIQRSFKNFSL